MCGFNKRVEDLYIHLSPFFCVFTMNFEFEFLFYDGKFLIPRSNRADLLLSPNNALSDRFNNPFKTQILNYVLIKPAILY